MVSCNGIKFCDWHGFKLFNGLFIQSDQSYNIQYYCWIHKWNLCRVIDSTIRNLMAKDCHLKLRARDMWKSARFMNIFPTSSLYCPQVESTSDHLPVPCEKHTGRDVSR